MKRLLLFTLVVSGLALVVGSIASYGQGTPDEETPANEGVCDGLKADGITKGLYGLCVAFCEAQDCEATVDTATGEVTLDGDCRPSNPKLLEAYNKRKTDSDPLMPCVNVAQDECPCWTELELDALAPSTILDCGATPVDAHVAGLDEQCSSPPGFAFEAADTYSGVTSPTGFICRYWEGCPDARIFRNLDISEEEFRICYASLVAECAARGF